MQVPVPECHYRASAPPSSCNVMFGVIIDVNLQIKSRVLPNVFISRI
jgi:hypothetical protein